MIGLEFGNVLTREVTNLCEEKQIDPNSIMELINVAKNIDEIQEILKVNLANEIKIIL